MAEQCHSSACGGFAHPAFFVMLKVRRLHTAHRVPRTQPTAHPTYCARVPAGTLVTARAHARSPRPRRFCHAEMSRSGPGEGAFRQRGVQDDKTPPCPNPPQRPMSSRQVWRRAGCGVISRPWWSFVMLGQSSRQAAAAVGRQLQPASLHTSSQAPGPSPRRQHQQAHFLSSPWRQPLAPAPGASHFAGSYSRPEPHSMMTKVRMTKLHHG
jgi:hypothetical protein